MKNLSFNCFKISSLRRGVGPGFISTSPQVRSAQNRGGTIPRGNMAHPMATDATTTKNVLMPMPKFHDCSGKTASCWEHPRAVLPDGILNVPIL